MRVHILGICGTLMGSIALLARELGHSVTGTDENIYPPMSTQLERAGIELTQGYTGDCVPRDTGLVIVGNANLPRGNPALESVLNRGIPYSSGAEWLGRYLLQDRWVIAVAGTHGKTTTASMIGWILHQAGLEPGFLIGGIPRNFAQSSRLGETPFFVIEADEYDTSYFDRRSKFLHYHPRTLVMNNLEFDHADIFPDLDAIKAQFHLLLRSIPGEGLVIHPADDDNLTDVLSRGCWTPTLAVGGDQLRANMNDSHAFDVLLDGVKKGSVSWELTGQHNIHNALSAIAAARHAGVAIETACEALCGFQGVKRRMEVIYESPQLTVYDDFAHHPTEIRTTLNGLRHKAGDDRIVAIIEPASHTMRLGIHRGTLLDSITDADLTYWYQGSGVKWDMNGVAGDRSRPEPDLDKLLESALVEADHEGGHTHMVIMSNGSFMGFHEKLKERLKANEQG